MSQCFNCRLAVLVAKGAKKYKNRHLVQVACNLFTDK